MFGNFLWLYSPLLDLAAFSICLILYTVGRICWTGDEPISRPLPTHRTTQTQNKRTQTSMPRVGFEPKIPVFERAKTVHALDRAAAVNGSCLGTTLVNQTRKKLRADQFLDYLLP
jgi:hypothetical protein